MDSVILQDASRVPVGPPEVAPLGRTIERSRQPERPVRWGLGDVALGGLVVVAASMAAGMIGLLLAFVSSGPAEPGVTPDAQLDALLAAPAVLALGLVGQQGAQAAWPWLVSRWKGRTLARDFGVTFRWSDLWIGPACGVGLLIVVSVVGELMARAVGLEQPSEASNTGIVTAGGASAWAIVLYACIVVGAPISEELFFRGLVLRSVAKRFRSQRAGVIAGVAASTFLFTAVHYQSTTPEGLAVLLSSIAVVGLVFGIMAVRFGRLGPSIVAHATINAAAVLAVLSAGG